MTLKIPRYEFNREPFMTEVPDFNRKSKLFFLERVVPKVIPNQLAAGKFISESKSLNLA